VFWAHGGPYYSPFILLWEYVRFHGEPSCNSQIVHSAPGSFLAKQLGITQQPRRLRRALQSRRVPPLAGHGLTDRRDGLAVCRATAAPPRLLRPKTTTWLSNNPRRPLGPTRFGRGLVFDRGTGPSPNRRCLKGPVTRLLSRPPHSGCARNSGPSGPDSCVGRPRLLRRQAAVHERSRASGPSKPSHRVNSARSAAGAARQWRWCIYREDAQPARDRAGVDAAAVPSCPASRLTSQTRAGVHGPAPPDSAPPADVGIKPLEPQGSRS